MDNKRIIDLLLELQAECEMKHVVIKKIIVDKHPELLGYVEGMLPRDPREPIKIFGIEIAKQ